MIKRNQIIFMEELCIQEMRKGLLIRKGESSSKVIPLPFSFNNVELQQNGTRKKSKIFRIGTMSRFDFPFKGYIFGLIDFFAIFSEHIDSELIICGFGESKQKVIDKIESLPDRVKKRIQLLDAIEYSKLNSFFDQLDVFFGMGTTLIDSARNNIIAIPVEPYTYDLVSDGFFYTHPKVTLADKKNAVDIRALLDEIIGYTDQEYYEHVKLQFDLVKETYDIDRFMEYVINS